MNRSGKKVRFTSDDTRSQISNVCRSLNLSRSDVEKMRRSIISLRDYLEISFLTWKANKPPETPVHSHVRLIGDEGKVLLILVELVASFSYRDNSLAWLRKKRPKTHVSLETCLDSSKDSTITVTFSNSLINNGRDIFSKQLMMHYYTDLHPKAEKFRRRHKWKCLSHPHLNKKK